MRQLLFAVLFCFAALPGCDKDKGKCLKGEAVTVAHRQACSRSCSRGAKASCTKRNALELALCLQKGLERECREACDRGNKAACAKGKAIKK